VLSIVMFGLVFALGYVRGRIDAAKKWWRETEKLPHFTPRPGDLDPRKPRQ
jgi:hypothetical protein